VKSVKQTEAATREKDVAPMQQKVKEEKISLLVRTEARIQKAKELEQSSELS
jgi:hypothetical protein